MSIIQQVVYNLLLKPSLQNPKGRAGSSRGCCWPTKHADSLPSPTAVLINLILEPHASRMNDCWNLQVATKEGQKSCMSPGRICTLAQDNAVNVAWFSVRVPYLTFDLYDNIAIYYLQVLTLYWLPGHQQMLSSQSSELLWLSQGVVSNYWCGSQ